MDGNEMTCKQKKEFSHISKPYKEPEGNIVSASGFFMPFLTKDREVNRKFLNFFSSFS